MTRHFQAAPFLLQDAVRANQERAALDAFDLFAIHDLVFDHAEHVTHFFFGVSNQFERQFKLRLELVVRLHVVTRHAKNGCAGLGKVFVFVAKLHGFGRAAWGVVFRVKVKHHRLTQMRLVGNLDLSGGVGFEFGNEFVDNDCHAVWTLT